MHSWEGGCLLSCFCSHKPPFCFCRQVHLGFLKICRCIANTPALGPREAQMLPGALRGNLLHFFPDLVLKKVPFYSWQVPFRVLGGVGREPSKRGGVMPVMRR